MQNLINSEHTSGLPTAKEYHEAAKIEMGEYYSPYADGGIYEDHYKMIEYHMKAGGKISLKVYDSIDSGKKYHFNKHYNLRGDKVTFEQ